MDIIEENYSDGDETVKDELILISDPNSDEEFFYTYATFATCEEAKEVLASMQQQARSGHEEVLNNQQVITDEYGNPIAIQIVDVKDIKREDDSDDQFKTWHINTTEEEDSNQNEITTKESISDDSHHSTWYTVTNSETNHSDKVSQAGVNAYDLIIEEDGGEYESKLLNVNNKSFVCPYCGNSHTAAGPLKLHMRACRRKKYPEEDKKCRFCEKTFQEDRYLKQHLLLHFGGYCARCFRSFANEKKLKEHIEEHKLQDEQSAQFNGQNVKVKAFTCCNCSKQFSVVSEHGCIKRRYVCDPCREMFTNAEKVKQPPRATKRKHEYSCNGCERRFVFIGSLQRHLDECEGTSPHSSRKEL